MSTRLPAAPASNRVSSRALVPVRARSALVLTLVFLVGIAAFGWPFVIEPGSALDTSHSADAPLLFVVLLPLLAAVVLAELTSGGMDAKAVALLKEWRKAQAKKQGVPPFRIMADKTLMAIAEEQPSNLAELMAISGIGLKTVEKYGAQIYKILEQARG